MTIVKQHVFVSFFLLFVCQTALATDYYVDALAGNDSNTGTSETAAWKTLGKVNATTFAPSDNIYFKAGQSWFGTLKPKGSGQAGSPITMGSYGIGSRPAIHGDGTVNCTEEPGAVKYCTILLNNQEYWIVRDLEITNFDPNEEGGKTLSQWETDNVTNYAGVTNPAKYGGLNSKKCAIMVEAKDMGAVNQLHFINLEVHGVNGSISQKNNGGIFLRIFNYDSLSQGHQATYFDDLLIEDCYIHDVDRTGVSNVSDYDDRTFTLNDNWTPSLSFIVRGNTFERTGANALIVRVADNPLIENNIFDHCSIKESGNTAFNFNTDNAIWQFNEFSYTKANVGDHDAGGVDSDYKTKGTIIQYNYLHDNDFGMLVTGGPGSFNDGTIVRYNIFERDGLIKRYGSDKWFVLRSSGAATNTTYHNNVIYLDSSQDSVKLVFHKGWSGNYPDNTKYYNNIFYNQASNSTYEFTSSTNNLFSHNTFYGNSTTNTPTDASALTSDPKLNNPGSGINGYKMLAGSASLRSGLHIESIPNKDYYHNEINGQVDRGVHQASQPDPSLTTHDAFVRDGANADTNYGSLSQVKVKASTNSDYRRRGYLKFDVSEYQSVSRAVLSLYGSAQSVVSVDVYKTTDNNWSENTITWNSAPSMSTKIGSIQLETTDMWYYLDITSHVQSALSGTGILTIGLKDDEVTVKNIDFFSKESNQGEYAATLQVDGQLPNEKHVYLVIGQSNTAGRADITSEDTGALSNVYLLDDQGQWEAAENPLNKYSNIRKDLSVQKLGFGYTFGKLIQQATGDDIGLVVNARGGSNINEWLKGASAGYYDSALIRIQTALNLPSTVFKGIVWHQGESNKNDTLTYMSKLETLIQDLRDDLNAPSVPFIAGQISEVRLENMNFNEMIKFLPNTVLNADYVSSRGLDAFDLTHFDSPSQRILGRRYASKVLEYVYGFQPYVDTVWVQEDSYVQGGTSANNNYGTVGELRIKESSNESYTRRSYLKFDLSGTQGYLIDADLIVNGEVQDNKSFDVAVYESTDSWNESTITWNNRPALSNKFEVIEVSGSSYTDYSFFVSEYAVEQSEGDETLSLGMKDNALEVEQFKMISKDDISNQQNRPYLLIEGVKLTSGSSSGRLGNSGKEQIGLSFNNLEPIYFQLYPNPNIGSFTLSGSDIKEVFLLDLNGVDQRVIPIDFGDGTISFDVSYLPNGIYFIKAISSESEESIIRMIKR